MSDQLQLGTICRLNRDNGFGYVRDAAHEHSFIFLFGRALTWAQASELRIGTEVRFRVGEKGRVHEVVSSERSLLLSKRGASA